MQIIDTIKTLVIQTIEFIHVKGHQDNTKNIDNLEWPVKMYIYCDQLATKTLEKYKDTLEMVPMLPASIIQLKIKQRHITHHISSQIRHLWSADAQKNYLIQRHKWNNETYNDIDWELLGSTIKTFSIKKKWFIMKWIYHLLPFNERHYIFNMTSDQYCPSKCIEKENEKHFL